MNRNATISLMIIVGSMLACAVPAGMTATPAVVTQIVVVPNQEVQQVQASPTLPLPTEPPPTVPVATDTLIATDTPVNAATPKETATTSGPVATLIKDANCRAGPGTQYEVVTSFFEGETLQIVGRNPDFDNTWWYVVIPSTGGKCWISLTTAQAYGDFDAIPTVMP